MYNKCFLCIFLYLFVPSVKSHFHLEWDPPTEVFDTDLYERVLDPEECSRQLSFLTRDLRSTILLARFLEAGIRAPLGVLIGNNVHLGNYEQCLGISHTVEDLSMSIEGKYCMIQIPGNQSFTLSTVEPWSYDPNQLMMDEEMAEMLTRSHSKINDFRNMFATNFDDGSRTIADNPFAASTFRVAVCVPKVCTTREFIDGLLVNLTSLGFEYRDDFCRLNNDKPWSPADTAAVVIFSMIGGLALISTTYDLWQTFLLRKDPKSINTIYRSFSVYTNTRRLLNFPKSPNAIECLDGVRALAMVWVVVGHSFAMQMPVYNTIDVFQWMLSWKSLWVQAAHLTVDSFFLLSGLLVVYTTAGKLTSVTLLKNIHLFYLNRLLRIFPILATMVLLEASLLYRVFDGPVWGHPADDAARCRSFWWTTLLHVQNYVNPTRVCIGVTWYLAIDMQLHILSPIVLVWVLSGNNKLAWSALTAALIGILTGATVYCFQNGFPTGVRGDLAGPYLTYYYMNTLTRASPFVVGMIYGYILHRWRNERIKIPALLNILLWGLSLSLLGLTGYAVLPTVQPDWDNQLADNLYNSFVRPTWAMALGWIIFACAKGYGGPVNWFLSHRMWKLPARLSYAMYLFHFSLIIVLSNTRMQPIWFSVEYIVFLFFGYTVLTVIVSFAATVLIDSPFSIYFKLLMDRGVKKKDPAVKEERLPYRNNGILRAFDDKRQ